MSDIFRTAVEMCGTDLELHRTVDSSSFPDPALSLPLPVAAPGLEQRASSPRPRLHGERHHLLPQKQKREIKAWRHICDVIVSLHWKLQSQIWKIKISEIENQMFGF